VKYFTFCLLSFASMLTSAASPVPVASIAPILIDTHELLQAGALGAADGGTAVQPLLMIMLLAALIAMQLRRRQKSLRRPRLLA
jgi:uncharacterized membrane protein